jgi:hypothetical protein
MERRPAVDVQECQENAGRRTDQQGEMKETGLLGLFDVVIFRRFEEGDHFGKHGFLPLGLLSEAGNTFWRKRPKLIQHLST